MRIVAFPVLAIAALSLAAPAQAGFRAQGSFGSVPVQPQPVEIIAAPDSGVGQELEGVDDRIEDARDSGRISRSEARHLRREAGVIGRHSEIYGRDGLSDSERQELRNRSLYLKDSIFRSTVSGSGASDARQPHKD